MKRDSCGFVQKMCVVITRATELDLLSVAVLNNQLFHVFVSDCTNLQCIEIAPVSLLQTNDRSFDRLLLSSMPRIGIVVKCPFATIRVRHLVHAQRFLKIGARIL